MGGLLSALNAAKTSLTTNQKVVEIAGNNIANANTPGYSRQNAVLTPYPALNFNGFFIGDGVKVSSVQRQHDVFIANQLLDKNTTLGEENGKSEPLNELQQVFDVSDNNLASQIDQFFGAWQQLSANPSGQVERGQVLQQGDLLCKAFQSSSQSLDTVQKNINTTLSSKIADINSQLQQVADLNQRIAGVETSGQTDNSGRDERDQLLQSLSSSLGIQSVEENNGMVDVQLPSGLPLVSGNSALSLSAGTSGSNLQLQLHMGQTAVDLNADKIGGEFKGLLEMRDNFIPQLQGNLDQLAYDLGSAVNDQHQQGNALDGTSAGDFFSGLTAGAPTGAASEIGVAITDSSQVAAAGSGSTASAVGDNTNALAIAALGTAKKANNNEDTFDSFYGKMTSSVGIEASQNQLALSGAQDAVTQLQNLRDGQDGVSIDQEMINLIQYQKGFQASAKFLTTVDQMMDSLLASKQ